MYVHVAKEKRAKLEPSGKKGIFVGYSDCSKAYRVYISRQRHIEVSRDVIFHEEAMFRKILFITSAEWTQEFFTGETFKRQNPLLPTYFD